MGTMASSYRGRRRPPPENRSAKGRTACREVAAREMTTFLKGKLADYAEGSVCRERLEAIIDDMEREADER